MISATPATPWIPAFAGMTKGSRVTSFSYQGRGRVFLAGDKPQRYVFFLSTMPRFCLARTRAVLAIQAQAVVASGSASMF